nr:hypothetical protein GCM10020093_074400 [Planobispora longispora]
MPSPSGTARRLPLRQIVSVVTAILLVTYLVLVPLGLIAPDHRLSTAEILVAVAVLVLSQYSIEDLTFDAGGASRIRLRRIEDRQRAIESDIQVLQVALSGIVTKHELRHLRGLAAPGRSTSSTPTTWSASWNGWTPCGSWSRSRKPASTPSGGTTRRPTTGSTSSRT